MNLKKLFLFAIIAGICIMPASQASAEELDFNNIPVIDDSYSDSENGKIIYQHGDQGFVFQTWEITDEEKMLGEALQNIHVDANGVARHFSLTPHKHYITDIVEKSPKRYSWNPTPLWTVNSLYSDMSVWPTVAWTTDVTLEYSASYSVSAGVEKSVVSATLGKEYTIGGSISTDTTRSFYVPYKYKGRVVVYYYRPYKTFTCVTENYYANGSEVVTIKETGEGFAYGSVDLDNIDVNIELRSLMQ